MSNVGISQSHSSIYPPILLMTKWWSKFLVFFPEVNILVTRVWLFHGASKMHRELSLFKDYRAEKLPEASRNQCYTTKTTRISVRLEFRDLGFEVWGLGFQDLGVQGFKIQSLGFLIFLRTKLECLEEFWDTLQFYFEDLGLK